MREKTEFNTMKERRDRVLEFFKSKNIRLKDVYIFTYPATDLVDLERFVYRKSLATDRMEVILQRSEDLMEQVTSRKSR